MSIIASFSPAGKGEIRTALQAAVALHQALGCNVFPIPKGSKTPKIRWRDLQKRKLSQLEIMGLFEPDPEANIAVICGKVSDLVVLDCDAPEVLQRFGRIPDTPTCETARGRHFYFRLGDRPIRTARLADGLDLRAEGSYVIAPPSVHPCGKRYEWVISPFEKSPASPPPELLEMISQRRPQLPLSLPQIAKGVPEGWRNIESAKVIGKVLRTFPISDWEIWAWPLVKAWNTLNRPPLDEKQLRATFECLARKEAAKRKDDDAIKKAFRIALKRSGLSIRQLEKEAGAPRMKLWRFLKEDKL